MKKLVVFLIFALLSNYLEAQHAREKYYQNLFARSVNGKVEVSLPDRTRIDILTETYSIEVEFCSKWSNSIGQALYYSLKTNKLPGIVLIKVNQKDSLNIVRTCLISTKYKIKVWVIDSSTRRIYCL